MGNVLLANICICGRTKYMHIWQDEIQEDYKGTECEFVPSIYFVRDGIHWWAVTYTTKNWLLLPLSSLILPHTDVRLRGQNSTAGKSERVIVV